MTQQIKENRAQMATTTKTNRILASKKVIVPSGYPAYRWYMTLWFILFTILYIGTARFFGTIQEYLSLPPSRTAFCQDFTGNVCWRADLFAYQVVSGAALTWAGMIGIWAWHIRRVDRSIPSTPEGRLFGYIPLAHQLTALATTFQLFDLVVSLLIPEKKQPLMLVHHIKAATVSWYGLNNQVRTPRYYISKELMSRWCFDTPTGTHTSFLVCLCSTFTTMVSSIWAVLKSLLSR